MIFHNYFLHAEDFANFCVRLMKAAFKCDSFQKYAKSGEPQGGIDIIDFANGSPFRACQCKLHESHKTCPPKEIRDEVEKAARSAFKLDEFYVLTSGRKTRHTDNAVIELNKTKPYGQSFTTFVWSWDEIQTKLNELDPVTRDHVVNAGKNGSLASFCAISRRIQHESVKSLEQSGNAVNDIETYANLALKRIESTLQQQPFKWFLPASDCVRLQRELIPSLKVVLDHAVRSPSFLEPTVQMLYSCILSEIGATQPDAMELDEISKRAFSTLTGRVDPDLLSIPSHLMAHNDNTITGLDWFIRQRPFLDHELEVADRVMRNGLEAMAYLERASRAFSGWQERIDEMERYQLSTVFVRHRYHPKWTRSLFTRKLLEELREKTALVNPIHARFLLGAELTNSVLDHRSTELIALIDKWLPVFQGSKRQEDEEARILLHLNRTAVDAPKKFPDACGELRSIPPESVGALLRRDATLLLPQTIQMLMHHIPNVYPAASLRTLLALRSPSQ